MEKIFEILLLSIIMGLSLIGIIHNTDNIKPKHVFEKILVLGLFVPIKFTLVFIFFISFFQILNIL